MNYPQTHLSSLQKTYIVFLRTASAWSREMDIVFNDVKDVLLLMLTIWIFVHSATASCIQRRPRGIRSRHEMLWLMISIIICCAKFVSWTWVWKLFYNHRRLSTSKFWNVSFPCILLLCIPTFGSISVASFCFSVHSSSFMYTENDPFKFSWFILTFSPVEPWKDCIMSMTCYFLSVVNVLYKVITVLNLINANECPLFMLFFDFFWYPFPVERETLFTGLSNKGRKTNSDILWKLRWKY